MLAESPVAAGGGRPPLRAFLPCAVLIAVALLQIGTAFTTDLTPWKGGGFGMFSSADTGGNRQVRVYAILDSGERRVLLGGRDRPRRVMLNYPTEQRVGAYADMWATRLVRRYPDLRAVRVELWRTSFDPETRVYRSEPWHDYLLELAPGGATGAPVDGAAPPAAGSTSR